MLLPALPQPQHVPHVDFGSGVAAVSGARGCCAAAFTEAGGQDSRKEFVFLFCNIFLEDFSFSRSFLAYSFLSSVFLALFFLDYMFPSYVYSLLFHSNVRFFSRYFCFPLFYCISFHLHFFPRPFVFFHLSLPLLLSITIFTFLFQGSLSIAFLT